MITEGQFSSVLHKNMFWVLIRIASARQFLIRTHNICFLWRNKQNPELSQNTPPPPPLSILLQLVCTSCHSAVCYLRKLFAFRVSYWPYFPHNQQSDGLFDGCQDKCLSLTSVFFKIILSVGPEKQVWLVFDDN